MSRIAFAVLVLATMCFAQMAGIDLVIWRSQGGEYWGGDEYSVNQDSQMPNEGSIEEEVNSEVPISATKTQFVRAEEQISGVLQPVTIEQRGYDSSGNLSARTDTREGMSTDLSIDALHGWKGSLAEVNVSGLQRLYVVNGSFNSGTPGSNVNPNGSVTYHPTNWDAISYSADISNLEAQVATYDSSGSRFISVQNQGKSLGPTSYKHFAGSYILWTQTVTNVPKTTQFTLRFSYLYLTGPIGLGVPGACRLTVYLNQTRIWNQSLAALGERGVWYSTGSVLVDKPTIGNVFDFKVGIVIDSDMTLSTTANYTGSYINAAYITVNIEDVLLISAAPPSFGSVALQFKAGSTTVAVTGSSGIGYARIVNSSYWTSSSLTVGLQSNISVSFYYTARVLCLHFGNSSWTSDVTKTGVAYDAHLWSSSDLSLLTYLGSLGSYEQFSLRITTPWDWANATVLDPFSADVTAQCSIGPGLVTVPQSVLSLLGWWQVTLQAPNYLKAVVTQKYNSQSSSWSNESSFRSDNVTRALVNIGTQESVPEDLSNVNATWVLPNGSVWADESLSGGASGWISSSSHVIDSWAAGSWSVIVSWSNGSEIAYGNVLLGVYHRATLFAVYDEIETDAGLVITSLVRLTDSETGRYLMDDSVSVVGNWSGADTVFLPNVGKNWWEGSFDTSLVEPGLYVVRVNASRPYYDGSYCLFVIRSTAETRLASPNSPWSSCAWNSTLQLTFAYEVLDFESHVWIPVTNSSGDVHAGLNWTAGHWSVSRNETLGVYVFIVDTGSQPSGNWLLNFTFTKPAHQPQQLLIMLLVSPVVTTLTFDCPTSGRVDINQEHSMKIMYADSNGVPIGSANVTVDDVSPAEGLQFSPIAEIPSEPGNYTVTLTPRSPGLYTVRFLATKSERQSATSIFVLLVNDVAASLSIMTGHSAVIDFTDVYTAAFRHEMLNGSGIEGALIDIVFSGPSGGLEWSAPLQTGVGNYSVEFSPITPGTYLVTIAASMPYYQSSSDSFFLIVNDIATSLDIITGGSAVIGFTDVYTAVFHYEMLNGSGIEDALIDIVFSGPTGGLEWSAPLQTGVGNYSVEFSPSTSGTYLVTIAASMPYYQSSSDSFFLFVGEISSGLASVNGTAASILYGQSYRLVVRYTNSSGSGLDGADVGVESVSPLGALEVSAVEPLGQGNYSIVLSPTQTKTVSVLISASFLNHQKGFATFTLTTLPIPAFLSVADSTAVTSIDCNFTLYMGLRTDNLVPLAGAAITVQNPPVGVAFVAPVDLGNGLYALTMVPVSIGAYDMLFRATLPNYQNATAAFTLNIVKVPTTLRIAGGLSYAAVRFGNAYALRVMYERADMMQNITDATIGVYLSPEEGLTWTVQHLDGYYSVGLLAESLGRWTITVSAERENHTPASVQFVLDIITISTTLDAAAHPGTVNYSRPFLFTLTYRILDNQSGVSGASPLASGDGSDWISIHDLGNGIYSVNVTPFGLGDFSPLLTFDKPGYESKQYRLSFTVVKIPLKVQLMSSSFATEGVPFDVIVKVTEEDTGRPVSNASVSFRISSDLTGDYLSMAETDLPGIYSRQYVMPTWVAQTGYTLEIAVSKDNYQLRSGFSAAFFKDQDLAVRMAPVVTYTGFLAMAGLVTAVGVRISKKRQRRRNLDALSVKKRFDDAANIIGLIVLHKVSGVPLYSKILRGGFEEGMISAFVSAITSFRSEFGMDESHMEYQVIPISDIITAVATRNLICAFMTVSAPSAYQQVKMEAYARSCGAMFDDTLGDVRAHVVDQETVKALDSLFYEVMDGSLLVLYRRRMETELPRRLKSLLLAVSFIERPDGFLLSELAKEMTSSGVEESQAYKLIMDAMDGKVIVRADNASIEAPPLTVDKSKRTS